MAVFNALDIARVLPSLHNGENITAINYFGNSVTIPSDEIAVFLTENNPSLIVYGVSIGLCGTLLVILLSYFLHPVTDGQSWIRRPIFLLSLTNLLLVLLEASLEGVLYSSPSKFNGVSQVFLDVPLPNPVMAAALVETGFAISRLAYVTVAVTFLLQVRVVYSVAKRLRLVLTVFLGAVCLLVAALFATAFAMFTKHAAENRPDLNGPDSIFKRVEVSARITFIVYVVFCSFLFTGKLAATIARRRKVGITAFGPLHILLIVSFQSLVIPGTCLMVPSD